MTNQIDLSIIIVSYNTKVVLLNCLNSIKEFSSGFSYEVIVVDNASSDGSLKALYEYSKNNAFVKVIDGKKNLGFGKGNNLGTKEARGEYLLFLNSDTLLIDNALKVTLTQVRELDQLGIYSCKLLNADKSTQASGGYFPNLFNVFAWQFFLDDLPIFKNLIPSFHPQTSASEKNHFADWVTGAFMLMPKSVFDKLGGFDENIFMYTEEMELAYRVKLANLKTYFSATPSIIHLAGASSGSFFALTSELKYLPYFWQKHKPHWQMPILKLFLFTGSLLRLLIFGIIKGDETRKRAYTTALRNII